jgi:hypothetical protein
MRYGDKNPLHQKELGSGAWYLTIISAHGHVARKCRASCALRGAVRLFRGILQVVTIWTIQGIQYPHSAARRRVGEALARLICR